MRENGPRVVIYQRPVNSMIRSCTDFKGLHIYGE
jgi:hypothetical protein